MYALIDMIRLAANLFSLLIIARTVLSWTGMGADHPAVALVHRLTEPLMAPARRLIPSTGGMDFSPMLVLVGIWIAERLAVRVLLSLA